MGQESSGRTPLYVASDKGHLEVVRVLLDHGADVNTPAAYAGSALFAACCNGHVEVVRILLEHGAAPNQAGVG
jgi:ankyrin repeat protein